MDDSDSNSVSDSDSDSDSDDEQSLSEEEQIAAAAAAEERRLELISLLQRKGKFHARARNKIDELVEEFLTKTKDDIHDMLCDNKVEADDYGGLDSNRDTEDEVETAIRFFPDVLTRKGGHNDSYFPIQLLSFAQKVRGSWLCSVKAVSFIPLVAEVAIELGLFEEDERGGLFCQDILTDNVLHHLMLSDHSKLPSQEHHKSVDTKYLQVLMQLRKLGLLKKEDIQRYGLLHNLCSEKYFAEKRFRFLVEWDPNALTQTDEHFGYLPLHRIAQNSSIQGFRTTFEYGILYYPIRKGISLIFKKNINNRTPFQIACNKYGDEEVMRVIEDTLIRYSSSDNNTPPLNVMEALITAAIDENVHVDCGYFLLRREPDVLVRLLSSSSSSSAAAASVSLTPGSNGTIITSIKSKCSNNSNSNKNDIKYDSSSSSSSSIDNDDSNVDDNLIATTNSKKRKRKRKVRGDHK